MTTPSRRRRRPNRGNGGAPAQPSTLWRAVPEPAPPAPVRPAQDPTALLRSLGTPPLPSQAGASDATLALVTVHASRLAIALAAAAGLLDETDGEGE